MTVDEINRSFPKIADWVQGAEWIEIVIREWQGFRRASIGRSGRSHRRESM